MGLCDKGGGESASEAHVVRRHQRLSWWPRGWGVRLLDKQAAGWLLTIKAMYEGADAGKPASCEAAVFGRMKGAGLHGGGTQRQYLGPRSPRVPTVWKRAVPFLFPLKVPRDGRRFFKG